MVPRPTVSSSLESTLHSLVRGTKQPRVPRHILQSAQPTNYHNCANRETKDKVFFSVQMYVCYRRLSATPAMTKQGLRDTTAPYHQRVDRFIFGCDVKPSTPGLGGVFPQAYLRGLAAAFPNSTKLSRVRCSMHEQEDRVHPLAKRRESKDIVLGRT
jgi:hypothetical protein